MAGGVGGPASFVAAWAISSAVAEDYSAVGDTISRLAAAGASTQPLMTAGLIGFGVGVGAWSGALRSALPGPAWTAALTAAVASFGVAATPLDTGVDDLHALFAGTGYATMAALPVLAAPALARAGRQRAAVVARLCALAAAGALVGAVSAPSANGVLQRFGLGVVDIWIATMAVTFGRASWRGPPEPRAATAEQPPGRG
ncbi:MAG: DUF998 domain-containing protein [Acidimicrobiia bacterium]